MAFFWQMKKEKKKKFRIKSCPIYYSVLHSYLMRRLKTIFFFKQSSRECFGLENARAILFRECGFSHHQLLLLSPNILPRENNAEVRGKKTTWEKRRGHPAWSQVLELADLEVFTLLISFSSLGWASKPVSHCTGGNPWLGAALQSRSNDFHLRGGWWLKTSQLETLADDLITPSILRERLAKDPNKSIWVQIPQSG